MTRTEKDTRRIKAMLLWANESTERIEVDGKIQTEELETAHEIAKEATIELEKLQARLTQRI